MSTKPSPNFAYLAYHDARLVALGTQAENHFADDPTITLFKLRQFAEVLAQRAAARFGLLVRGEWGQQQLIDRLWEAKAIGATQRSLFHDLRRVGNAAVHESKGDHGEALHQLRMARELAVWFQRTFGNNKKFDPGPFVPPPDPKSADAPVHDELERLRKHAAARESELQAAQAAIEEARRVAEAQLAERLTAQQRAEKAREDAAIWWLRTAPSPTCKRSTFAPLQRLRRQTPTSTRPSGSCAAPGMAQPSRPSLGQRATRPCMSGGEQSWKRVLFDTNMVSRWMDGDSDFQAPLKALVRKLGKERPPSLYQL